MPDEPDASHDASDDAGPWLVRALSGWSRSLSNTARLVLGSYAALVIGTAWFVYWSTTTESGSFAAIWLMLVTFPSSLLTLPVLVSWESLSDGLSIALMAFGGLAQAVGLQLVLARAAARRTRRAPALNDDGSPAPPFGK